MMTKRLYRDPIKGKLAGVCAGIAEYFSIEIWIVRIVVVVVFFLGFGIFATFAYVAAVLIIEKKPEHLHFQQAQHIKQKPWQQGKPAVLVLHELDAEIRVLEGKVIEMETYVTSREFELNRQFKHL